MDTGHIEILPQRSAEEAVTEALRKAIHSGYLKPGQRLSQADLAKQLGVSRIPLRDALRRLESESLVTINGRQGTWVSSLSVDAIKEIYEIRLMLEQCCTIHAVKNMTDDDLAEILELFDKMDSSESETDAESKDQSFSARRNFYSRLYACANRPMMQEQIMLLRDNVSRYHLVKDHGHAHDHHREFRDTLTRRDARGAARILKRHLELARDDLIKHMQTED